MRINIKVRGFIAALDSIDARIVGRNTAYTVHFDFDEAWDAAPVKTARFLWGGNYTDVVLVGDSCTFPMIDDVPFVIIGVYSGAVQTTSGAYVPMTRSILAGSATPAAPTPGVYDQIIALLNQTMVDVEADADRAATAATDAQTAKAGAVVAQAAAETAQTVAETAQTVSEAAAASAVAAKNAAEIAVDHYPRISETTGNWEVWSITAGAWTDTGVQAQGEDGAPGTDGITPTIGYNGNWYLGSSDTGKPSRGAQGEPGSDAEVTVENIEAALGYVPADEEDIPDLSPYRTAAEQDAIDAGKQDTIADLAAIRRGASAGAEAVPSYWGIAHANEFLVVGNDGDVTSKEFAVWQGGNY